jgi:uncharacterized C2H2 Zn-finger protein
LFVEDHVTEVDGLHVCPVCAKMFLEERALYQHIIRAHQQGEQMAYDMRADLYRRWQERIPRYSQ